MGESFEKTALWRFVQHEKLTWQYKKKNLLMHVQIAMGFFEESACESEDFRLVFFHEDSNNGKEYI